MARLVAVAFVAVAVTANACRADQTGPSDEAVKRLLETQDKQAVRITSLTVEAAPRAGSVDRLRLVIRGEGELQEDFIDAVNPDVWLEHCPDPSASLDADANANANNVDVYRRSAVAGQQIVIKGSSVAYRDGDAWHFTARRITYFDQSGNSISGNRASIFRSPIVIGTAQFGELCRRAVQSDQ